LLVPHLVRLAVGASLRRLLPLSLFAGAGFLVACDTIARSLVPGRELPVGVVTATLGAPGLVLLLFRARR
jgi:iron complex transport system permease protein